MTITLHLSEGLFLHDEQITSVDEDVEKRGPSCPVDGIVNDAAAMK